MIKLVTAAAFWAAFSLVHASDANAHEWYDPACCSGLDCAALPDDAVKITREGYRVRYIGKWGLPIDLLVPFDQARPSRDQRFHGCDNAARFLCLYAPFSV